MNRKTWTQRLAGAALVVLCTQISIPPVAQATVGRTPAVAQQAEVTVMVAALNVRGAPSLSAPILGRLAGGTKITPLGRSADGQWWRINYNGAEAFIFAQFAVAGGTYTAGTGAAGGGTATVTSDFLNVRSGPGLGNPIIGRLNRGNSVTVLGRSADGAWLRINYNGGEAFVFAAYTTAGGGAAAPAPAAPAAPAPAGRFSGFELGAHINTTQFLGQMRDIGMTWVKIQVVMPGGPPDLSGMIGAVHGAGMKILVGAVGDRARASDPNYHNEFAGHLAAIARQGADAIEVWNEPNLDREYGGSGNGQVNPENYANMLRAAYTAIKSANPNTLVISGAPAPTGARGGGCDNVICDDQPFLQRLAATGAAQWMDCIGAHHNGSPNPPDLRSGGPTGDHPSWYFWGTLDVTYNAFRGQRPVCWTELGYVTGEGIGPLPSGFAWGSNITLQNQADWLARAAQLSRDSGKVRIMIIWNADFRQWDDDPQAGYSIFRPNGECRACSTLRAVMGR
ncbi:MAG: SH3 domain-containing protein [Anaerolineae bacterium]|nr:SH3 domain-containing protein [Thermoflexales bacterium]MDW8407408.1 SH3 domain-containing protein [Anaerolineae bacterium]